jgi:outer membrane murein-binding lipoprotein Lpp
MRNTGICLMAIVLGTLALAGCSRESADWKSASAADTAEAYQQFLQQHPKSANAAQAQARIQQIADDRDWQAAAAADTRDAYQQFLAQHADSKWAQEARIRIENFAQAGASGGRGQRQRPAGRQHPRPQAAAAAPRRGRAPLRQGTSAGAKVASSGEAWAFRAAGRIPQQGAGGIGVEDCSRPSTQPSSSRSSRTSWRATPRADRSTSCASACPFATDAKRPVCQAQEALPGVRAGDRLTRRASVIRQRPT